MSNINRLMAPTGSLNGQVTKAPPFTTLTWGELKFYGSPQRGLSDEVNDFRSDNKKNIKYGLEPIKFAEKKNIATFYGRLWGVKMTESGEVSNFGLMGVRLVTTAGANKLVSLMNGADSTTGANFKYHALGTGGTASSPSGESATDTALVAEITTAYATDNNRPAGSQTVGSSNNIYRTVGSNTVDATVACIEHGVFSAATSGTLLDRTCFALVTLGATDTFTTTYDFTIVAGS